MTPNPCTCNAHTNGRCPIHYDGGLVGTFAHDPSLVGGYAKDDAKRIRLQHETVGKMAYLHVAAPEGATVTYNGKSLDQFNLELAHQRGYDAGYQAGVEATRTGYCQFCARRRSAPEEPCRVKSTGHVWTNEPLGSCSLDAPGACAKPDTMKG